MLIYLCETRRLVSEYPLGRRGGRRRHPLIFYLTAFEGSVVGDPAYLKNLRKFGSGELTTEELAALEAELYSGPDRAAAVSRFAG